MELYGVGVSAGPRRCSLCPASTLEQDVEKDLAGEAGASTTWPSLTASRSAAPTTTPRSLPLPPGRFKSG